eukprot:TRINITY_DN3665_c0_g2_i4.p1 TRINITY_DN3665_c0_g2~~TRINITY_DN3665_c0_g2_i4.p1  ORF type:complete len:350 (-),score=59.09 TRINITY_DN3665_c0_g2_i4:46-1095(-)
MMYEFNLKKENKKLPSRVKKRKSAIGVEAPGADSKLSDFEFLQVLGTGTFGKVRLCKHKSTKQYYCVKILRKDTIFKYKQVEHVKNEKAILLNVSHPGVVKLFYTFNDIDRIYLLMEYVPGGELFLYIRKYGKLPPEIVKYYCAEIILIIEHLHNKDIIYRDLKPENILLDVQGHVKLTDFGFAKHVADMTWTMCGTPDYIAPEVLSGKGHGKAVDWWSLGVLIFEMLAGYPPFTEESTMGLFRKIMEAEKLTMPQWFSPEVQDLLRRLLVVDPTRRLGVGKEDIKLHPFFSDINWQEIKSRERQGPFVPVIRDPRDTCHFQQYQEVPISPPNTDISVPANIQQFFDQF